MEDEIIYCYLLISLACTRILEPAEYRRVTDMSSREIESRIQEMVDRSQDEALVDLHREFLTARLDAEVEAVRATAKMRGTLGALRKQTDATDR